MTDTEMLDWMEECFIAFRQTMRDDDNQPYEMDWIDCDANPQVSRGNNIRDCVEHAVRSYKETK